MRPSSDSRRISRSICLLLLFLVVHPSWPIEAQTFEESASVVVVEVPVQVVDGDGKPVKGLRREDFIVTEDRREREIVDFEVIDRAVLGESAHAVVPPSGRRHFLLLFDLSFSNPSSLLKARQAADSVLTRMHPTDLVAVGTFSLLKGTELLVRFTPDRERARLAIGTLGAPQLVDRSPDPLGLMISGLESARSGSSSQTNQRGAAAQGFDRDGLVLEHLKELAGTTGRQDREAQATRIQGMVRSMTDLGGLMRSVEGRKYVVYFSEGFDSKLLTGEGGSNEDRNRSIESGEIFNVDTEEMFGSGRLQNSLEAMLESFRRADCTIQAVDIGGLRGDGEGPVMAGGQEGLFAMAKGTGGELYRNFNDLGEAMAQMLERTSVTYVLTFQPDDIQADGEFHDIKVKLRNGGRGLRLVHRPGYFGPKPPGSKVNPEEQRLALASKLLAGEVGGALRVGVLAVPFRGVGSRASVPVLIDIDGPSLATLGRSGNVPTEIYAYALKEDGSVADHLFQTLQFDLAKVGEKLRAGGVKYYGRFNLDPGQYTVRVLVRDSGAGTSGLTLGQVTVPDFALAELALLPPLVPDMTPDRWLMVRQAARPGETEPAYPFTLGEGRSFIPSVRPTLSPDKPLQLGVFVFNLENPDAAINAQVINANGDVVLGRQLPVIERHAATPGGPVQMLAALQIEAVPPGDYTLALTIADGRRTMGSLPVRIVPGSGATAIEGGGAYLLGSAGEVESGERVRGRERIAHMEVAYQQVLAKLSSGFERDASEALLELERAEAKTSEDLLLEALHDAEMATAKRLADQTPDALIPVMLLHEAIYLSYRDSDERLLARHSRTVVQELAELYVESGGTPTSVAANMFTSLGGSLQQTGLTASANSLFQRALDLEKNNEGALLSLAVYAEKTAKYEQAVTWLERLTSAHPDNSEAWLRLGINFDRLEKAEASARWLTKATTDKALPWVRELAFEELAAAARRRDDWAKAESILRAGIEALPKNGRFYLQLANVLDHQGQVRAGTAVLDDLLASPNLESSRMLYNRWPAAVLEASRHELKNTAQNRLAALAKAVGTLTGPGGSR